MGVSCASAGQACACNWACVVIQGLLAPLPISRKFESLLIHPFLEASEAQQEHWLGRVNLVRMTVYLSINALYFQGVCRFFESLTCNHVAEAPSVSCLAVRHLPPALMSFGAVAGSVEQGDVSSPKALHLMMVCVCVCFPILVAL